MVSIWRSISRCLSGGRFGERLMARSLLAGQPAMMGQRIEPGNRDVNPHASTRPRAGPADQEQGQLRVTRGYCGRLKLLASVASPDFAAMMNSPRKGGSNPDRCDGDSTGDGLNEDDFDHDLLGFRLFSLC